MVLNLLFQVFKGNMGVWYKSVESNTESEKLKLNWKKPKKLSFIYIFPMGRDIPRQGGVIIGSG